MNLDNNVPDFNMSGDVSGRTEIDGVSSVKSMMRIVIAGAGSIGTMIGLLLSRQGHKVALIRKSGKFGRFPINVIGIEEFIEEIDVVDVSIKLEKLNRISPDLIIISCQRQQLPLQLRQLRNTIGFENKPIILPLQNGLGTADLVCRWMKENKLQLPIIQAIIWWSATLIESTEVLYHNKAVTTIGIPQNVECRFAKENHLDKVYKTFNEILEVKMVDIDKEPFIKLILNVVSPILALVKEPYPSGLNDLNVRRVIKLLFDEVIEIAKKEGWYEPDERLNKFYDILSGNEKLDHYSIYQDLPSHKVSSQISAEKYGGKGSNVNLLLTYFVDRGANLCKRVLQVFLELPPNYEAISSDQLLDLLRIDSS